MKHVMIDLETLGTKHNSIFLSLAAVPFDLTGNMGKPFVRNITIESAQQAGLTIDASTLEWWMTQRPEIMKRMFTDPQPLSEVLDEFYNWFYMGGSLYPWGNSASFDLGILTNAYQKMQGKAQPWKFYNERCYRTLVALAPQSLKLAKPKDAHDPLQDCIYQIKQLCITAKHFGIKD